jgi:hypothetical protein
MHLQKGDRANAAGLINNAMQHMDLAAFCPRQNVAESSRHINRAAIQSFLVRSQLHESVHSKLDSREDIGPPRYFQQMIWRADRMISGAIREGRIVKCG